MAKSSTRNASSFSHQRNSKKTLNKMLRIGAIAATTMFGGMRNARANIIYDSGMQSATNHVAAGKDLIINYSQTIDDQGNSYKSTLNMTNATVNIGDAEGSFYQMNVGADLAGRGCTDITEALGYNWVYETTGSDTGRMIPDPNGTMNVDTYLIPTAANEAEFNYTILKEQVTGWENVDSEMVANVGSCWFQISSTNSRTRNYRSRRFIWCRINGNKKKVQNLI